MSHVSGLKGPPSASELAVEPLSLPPPPPANLGITAAAGGVGETVDRGSNRQESRPADSACGKEADIDRLLIAVHAVLVRPLTSQPTTLGRSMPGFHQTRQ